MFHYVFKKLFVIDKNIIFWVKGYRVERNKGNGTCRMEQGKGHVFNDNKLFYN